MDFINSLSLNENMEGKSASVKYALQHIKDELNFNHGMD
jgi:hypothetical protein